MRVVRGWASESVEETGIDWLKGLSNAACSWQPVEVPVVEDQYLFRMVVP